MGDLVPVETFNPTSLHLPDGLSLEAWTEFGTRLCAMEKGVQWCWAIGGRLATRRMARVLRWLRRASLADRLAGW